MKYLFPTARILLGLLFLIFGINFWLRFIPIPPAPEGSLAASFIGALYASGFLALVKVLEIVGGLLLIVGRYVNAALAVLGPIVVVIALYHILLVKGGYPMTAALVVLSLISLIGQRDFTKVLVAK